MIVPTVIRKIGDKQFKVQWSDGHESLYDAQYLRVLCPCAGCKDEFTGERQVFPDDVPMDTAIQKSEVIGNYALGFTFSDGHKTGIYSFDYLRSVCPCCRNTDVQFHTN